MAGIEALSSGAARGSFTGKRDDPATYIPAVVLSTLSTVSLPAGTCRFLFAASSGTISGQDASGSTFDGFPIVYGRNDLGVKFVSSFSSTAALFAAY